MNRDQLLEQFNRCLRYYSAPSWRKPFIDPGRFIANQWRVRTPFAPRPGTRGVARTFHHPSFTIVQGEALSNQVACYGIYEPTLTQAFLSLVEPGQVVVDIGMHLGYYTALFAQLVGPQGQVHAFEPTPSTIELARQNLNQFPQVKIHGKAVWSSATALTFRDYGPEWMAFNSFTSARIDGGLAPAREIQVQTTTLDEFRSELKCPISLIKIDAESAEKQILEGAQRLLKEEQPLLTVEVGDCGGFNESRELVLLIEQLNYAPWEFSNGRFTKHQIRSSYSYNNLIFAPEGRDLSS